MDYISCCRQDMVVLREKAKVIGSEEERNRRKTRRSTVDFEQELQWLHSLLEKSPQQASKNLCGLLTLWNASVKETLAIGLTRKSLYTDTFLSAPSSSDPFIKTSSVCVSILSTIVT